jgi:hypothetical protein
MAKVDRIYQTKVKPYLEEISEYHKAGYSEKSIAKYLDVSYVSFLKYKNKYTEFADCLNSGREGLIEEIERSIYKRALGKYTSTKIEQFFDIVDGEEVLVRKKITTETLPPSESMLKYVAQNLSDKWKEHSSEIQAEPKETIYFVDSIDKIPKEELLSLEKAVYDDADD